jgi:hypothetical protein
MQLPSARFTSADQFQRQRLIVGPKSTYWLLFSDQAQDVAALVAVNDADSALEGSGALAVPRRLTAADRSALHDLLLAHFDFIWRSLRRLGVPEDSVDDAAQQVFVVASRKIDRDPPRAPKKSPPSIAYGTRSRCMTPRVRSSSCVRTKSAFPEVTSAAKRRCFGSRL